ncbi:MAG: trypsin-like peptidase domain-containing protein [Gemmataceae bacterium]|nr:trypsin-like peptidase domain-containing protein [Gemmataceae bacterium]
MPRWCFAPGLVLAAALALPAAGDGPKPVAPAPREAADPWYVDDTELFDGLYEKLRHLADKGKCLPSDKMKEKFKPGRAAVELAKPTDKPLSSAEVYKRAVPSVFVLGSVYRDPQTGDWLDGLYATAWAAGPDGVLVTDWHVLEDLEPDEVFGAADHLGNVYPLTDILGGDKTADVLVLRVGGKGFAPLPVAEKAAPVASWVGVLSHPGDHFYLFTQGHVTRYSTNETADGRRERWMGVTAEFATGSSGGPVLDDRGNVAGMTALTVTIDSPPEEGQPAEKKKDRRRPFRKAKRPQDTPAPKADDPKGKGDPKGKDDPQGKPMPAPQPGSVQMVVKLAVPALSVRQVFGR